MQRSFLKISLLAVTLFSMPAAADEMYAKLAAHSAAVIAAHYIEFENSATHLAESVDQFCEETSQEHLIDLQDAWLQTAMAWDRADVYHGRPVFEKDLDFHINFWPANAKQIEKLLADVKRPLDAKLFDHGSVGRKGLAGLEYLLFSQGDSVDLQLYTDHKLSSRRCDYLDKVGAEIKRHAVSIASAWAPSENNYRAEFEGLSNELSPLLGQTDTISLLVTNLVRRLEAVQDRLLGQPLGSLTQGVVKPYRLQAWRSQKSLQRITAGLDGISRLYFGDSAISGSFGVHAYLMANKQVELAEKIAAEFVIVQKKVSAINTPVFTLLTSKPEVLLEMHAHLGQLRGFFREELTQAFGVTLGFNSEDGD